MVPDSSRWGPRTAGEGDALCVGREPSAASASGAPRGRGGTPTAPPAGRGGTPREIAILGIGNVLMGDDALGPYVVKLLEAAWEPLPGLRLLDAGTPGLDLTAYLAELDAVIVVDVVKASGPPGEVRTYGKAELVERPLRLATSPHEPGLREAILNADFLGVCPRTVRLVGVIPESVDYRLGLSAPVRAAVPAALERIRVELAAAGVTPVARAAPVAPDVWWERKASP